MLQGIVDIDRSSSISLSEQIYRQVRLAVRDGKFDTGQRLPSSRLFSRQLNVSRNVVSLAYDLLKAEAIIDVQAGSVPTIAAHTELSGSEALRSRIGTLGPTLSNRGQELCINPRAGWRSRTHGILAPGEPAFDLFPSEIWARTLRRVTRQAVSSNYHYQNVAGLPEFTSVLIEHLTEMRGVSASPEQILVTTSTQASLMLASLCLANPGDTALIENPGYLGARGSFQSAGLKIDLLAVDDKGAIFPSETTAPAAKVIYLTPSHQFPTGYTLSLSRRLSFIDHARKSGGMILEDDYDSEFLFAGRPVAAMQGLAPDSVIYMGTFSKSMMPGLRLAYMVVPENLIPDFKQAIRNFGISASATIQLAMADFMVSGHYRSHLKNIRETYKARGELLANSLKQQLGDDITIIRPNGGVQLAMEFTKPVDDIALATTIHMKGVNAVSLSSNYIENPKSGLVIGFGTATPKNISAGISVIKEALEEALERV